MQSRPRCRWTTALYLPVTCHVSCCCTCLTFGKKCGTFLSMSNVNVTNALAWLSVCTWQRCTSQMNDGAPVHSQFGFSVQYSPWKSVTGSSKWYIYIFFFNVKPKEKRHPKLFSRCCTRVSLHLTSFLPAHLSFH